MLTAVMVGCVLLLVGLGPPLERRRRRAQRLRGAAQVRVGLLETTRSLPGSDLPAAARIACEGLRSLGFDAAVVTVRRGSAMVPFHGDGIAELTRPLPAEGSFAGRCMAENRTIVVGDYASEEGRRPERAHLRSVVLAPVRVDGRPVATLSGARHRVAEPGPDEIAIVETVAVHLGRAFATESSLAAQEELLERMRRLDAMRSSFVSQVSDELRERLVVVRRDAQELIAGIDTLTAAERSALLEEVASQADSLRTTIDALLDFSRFQAERPEPELVPVAVGELLAPLRHAETRVSRSARLTEAFVRVDAALVRQGLELLLAGSGSDAVLELRPDDDGIRLAVTFADPTSARRHGRLVQLLAEQLLVAGGARLHADEQVTVHLPSWDTR